MEERTKTPKVFLSYSWSQSDNVLELAKRLIGDGIDVMFDKWDLKEGHDINYYMEQAVTDPNTTRVLVCCDKAYMEKANTRQGGVGKETNIILSEDIYNKAQQEKFIPVIMECDENGEPYQPTYIKTRFYINLANEKHFEKEYEKLVRNIFEKPLFQKPALGKPPTFLDNTQPVDFADLRQIINQIKKADSHINLQVLFKQFEQIFIDTRGML